MRLIGLAVVLALGVTLAPLAAEAQPLDRVYRVGFLGQTSAGDLARQTHSLRQGLRDLGYEEGRNLAIEYRWAERKLDRLPTLATGLVGAKVDIIVPHGSPGSRAAKQATAEIPIVIAVVGDPVASGVVLFPNDQNEPLKPKTGQKSFPTICRRAGVPEHSAYDLRHSYATWMLQAGAPLEYVSQQLGHRNTHTTLTFYAPG